MRMFNSFTSHRASPSTALRHPLSAGRDHMWAPDPCGVSGPKASASTGARCCPEGTRLDVRSLPYIYHSQALSQAKQPPHLSPVSREGVTCASPLRCAALPIAAPDSSCRVARQPTACSRRRQITEAASRAGGRRGWPPCTRRSPRPPFCSPAGRLAGGTRCARRVGWQTAQRRRAAGRGACQRW